MTFFEKYHKALFNCTKPYQYVGGEFLSCNKSFDDAKVRFALAFPDKYEIGISNLGLRVLYDCINSRPEYMADRVYAPEKDFKPEPLYALESKRPIKDFDAVGFSLQYEMAYPTVLKMLEMAGIPHRNDERRENDPIVFAGGPCAFNPLPMADFVDVFLIGDGEDSIVEVCEILEKTKGQPRAERIKALSSNGRWGALVGGNVVKRIAMPAELTSYPIPFSSSVHDRATVEIRRGCGRMCRFCQPGHVTLPVRERSAEDIIRITKELVKNTGYDEYSLLSLSSNDYSNIKEVIKELAADFDSKKISVSLPSQRIDGFNLELANLVQSVRKSTMTLAPEAGSQRLRNLIKKNISEEQILDAVTTLYENGWKKIKLYFICGLPTETLKDMEEMAELLKKMCKKGLQITCTLSIFVPKPFTPFQWHGQMNIDKVMEHIYYLKDRLPKGVKVNYHDKAVSQIEAVLTRGDSSLCDYIEALYKKGCYLDAWGEHFSMRTWHETAAECGVNLAELAERQYPLDKPLPWDFIDVGIDKEWFVKEFKACDTAPTCETGCVKCGVCKNLKTRKIIAKPYITNKLDCRVGQSPPRNDVFRYRLKITKTGILRYFSHLDWQGTFFKAISRSGLNVAFSQGFNPSMKISMGIALPLFVQSECELVDIELYDDISTDDFQLKLQKNLPKESQIINVVKINKSAPAIDHTACWAEYEVKIFNRGVYDFKTLVYNTNKLLSSEEIFIEKRGKKDLIKKIDIKKSIKSYRFEGQSLFIVLKTGQSAEIPALRADVLMNIIAPDVLFDITRTRFFDKELQIL